MALLSGVDSSKIPYYTCSQRTYNSLSYYNEDGLYYIKDTNVVYKGSVLYSKSVEVVPAYPTTDIAPGRLYINTTDNTAKTYLNGNWINCFSFGNVTTIVNRLNTVEKDVASIKQELNSGLNDKTFTFTQGIASEVWNITHNLNKFPSVTVVDSGGNICLTNIEYVDLNNLKIIFNSASSGIAYLN